MNGPLRFPDEFGRHKALDLIGDLALAGLPLLGHVEAHKAGHALHTQLVSRLLADPTLWTVTNPRSSSPGFRSAACLFCPGFCAELSIFPKTSKSPHSKLDCAPADMIGLWRPTILPLSYSQREKGRG